MGEVAGTVVAIHDGRAIVECSAQASGCASCSGGRGCSWRRLAGTNSLSIPSAQPGKDLATGDIVSLTIDDGSLLAAAARLYLPPLAGLLLGPALLQAITAPAAGPASLIAAAAGLLAGLVVARRWTARTPEVTVVRSIVVAAMLGASESQ